MLYEPGPADVWGLILLMSLSTLEAKNMEFFDEFLFYVSLFLS